MGVKMIAGQACEKWLKTKRKNVVLSACLGAAHFASCLTAKSPLCALEKTDWRWVLVDKSEEK